MTSCLFLLLLLLSDSFRLTLVFFEKNEKIVLNFIYQTKLHPERWKNVVFPHSLP